MDDSKGDSSNNSTPKSRRVSETRPPSTTSANPLVIPSRSSTTQQPAISLTDSSQMDTNPPTSDTASISSTSNAPSTLHISTTRTLPWQTLASNTSDFSRSVGSPDSTASSSFMSSVADRIGRTSDTDFTRRMGGEPHRLHHTFSNYSSSSETSIADPNAVSAALGQVLDHESLLNIASNQTHVGRHDTCIRPTEDIFNASEDKIKEDIIRIIVQYLSDEGYNASKLTVLDEANVKSHEREERHIDLKRMRKAVLDGDWAEVDKLCSKPLLRNYKTFLYAVYKQQYLEYIEHHEIQKAFTHLNKRLKPLEHHATTPGEFRDLCYLLTAKSVHDAPSFKEWEGVERAREKLVDQFQSMVNVEIADRE
ncbi:hypothetical protein HK097_004386, partial [Rhizophlyctis rosea]